MTSRKVIQTFIDERSGQLLDDLYHLVKDCYDRKRAEKAIKYMIKTVIKIGILFRNDQFSVEELDLVEDFKKKFRTLVMTVVSFAQVEFSYDRAFLVKIMNECCDLIKKLVLRHLTEKSLQRIDNVFETFGSCDFLDAVFKSDSPHEEAKFKVIQDLNVLLEANMV